MDVERYLERIGFGGEPAVDLPTLTSLVATYDHQWRRDSVRRSRVTISFSQRF